MAAAVLQQSLQQAGCNHVEVSSAGLNALSGHEPHHLAQYLMRERGLDVSTLQARQLTVEIISNTDLILVMERDQKRLIEASCPQARGKVYRIGEWSNFDVPDPLGQPIEFFENVLSFIDKGVADWVIKLKG
jgi:protein-tyrosine phosphatase